MRSIISRFILLAILGIPAGLCFAGAPLDTVTLQLRWWHQFQFAGYYAAQELGYYRAEGLEVKILPGRTTDFVAARVAKGDAEYGVSGTDILVQRQRGAALVVLAAIFQHSAHALAVRAESGILTPADFAGKRVMMNPDRDPDITAMFLRQHLDISSLSMVSDRWSLDEFAHGDVDAITCYTTSQEYALQRRGVRYRIVHPASYDVDFYGDCLFTTEREVHNHPDRVQAMRRASLKGWQYAMDHPEEIIRLILKRYRDSQPELVTYEALAFEATAMQRLVLPQLVEVGTMSTERWRRIAENYAEVGMVDRDVGPLLRGFIYEPGHPSDTRWVREVILAAVVVALGIAGVLIWNVLLRRQVRRRTAELQAKEVALAEANQALHAIIASAPIAITAVDTAGNVMEWNHAAESLFGWKAEEVVGREVPYIPREGEKEQARLCAGVLEGSPSLGKVLRRLRKDGTVLDLHASSAALQSAAGGIIGSVAMFVDLTETLRVEQQLRGSLLEKEVLLKEIHHRVKNNLQVISSLLSLQAERVLDPQAREVFRESQNRVRSMALIHERLYRSHDLAHVDFGEYVQNLAGSLCRSYNPMMPQVECEIDAAAVPLEIDVAIPCGLILNEVLSNALKYAFPNGRAGRIQVNFEQVEDERYRLEVCDNGVGLPAGFDARTAKSLGYQLVVLLVDQLKGTLSVTSEGGVAVTVSFNAGRREHAAGPAGEKAPFPDPKAASGSRAKA